MELLRQILDKLPDFNSSLCDRATELQIVEDQNGLTLSFVAAFHDWLISIRCRDVTRPRLRFDGQQMWFPEFLIVDHGSEGYCFANEGTRISWWCQSAELIDIQPHVTNPESHIPIHRPWLYVNEDDAIIASRRDENCREILSDIRRTIPSFEFSGCQRFSQVGIHERGETLDVQCDLIFESWQVSLNCTLAHAIALDFPRGTLQLDQFRVTDAACERICFRDRSGTIHWTCQDVELVSIQEASTAS